MTRVQPLAAACALAALAAVTTLPLSCATSSGSSYSRAEASEAGARSQAKNPAPPPRPSSPPPRPSSPPPMSPQPVRPPPPNGGAAIGTGDSHVEGGFTLDFGARSEEAEAPMGHLALEGLRAGFSVYVDGGYDSGSSVDLPPGSHELQVSCFGYRDFRASFSVTQDQTTWVQVEYDPAPFAIKSLDANPRSFDPADPGFLGSCVAEVLVSAEGSGEATVLAPDGRVLRDLGRLAFDGPSRRVRWDGRDGSGALLPPGDYLIHVSGVGADGGSDAADARVTVVTGSYTRSTTLYSGVSGALFAPDARVLPSGAFEAAVGTELHLSPSGTTMTGLDGSHAGIRFGLPSAGGDSELDVSLMGLFWQDNPGIDSFSGSVAWKRSLGGAPVATPSAAAVYVKATAARFLYTDPNDTTPPSWDGTTRFVGLSAGLPLEYASGSTRAFVSPEVEISNYYPGWGAPDAPWQAPGFFAWAYLRLGLETSAGPYSIALSGALRSAPFGGGLALWGPYPVGLEVRWHAPSSGLVLSFIATGEIEDLSNYFFGAGLGLGFRF